MNILIKAIITFVGIAFISNAIATTTTETKNTMSSMIFQVIQNQIVFDESTIESATLASPEKPSDDYGLILKLKPTAANKLNRFTEENIGQRLNMIFNGVIISSPIIQSKIGDEFQVTGFTKEQAEQFINGLANQDESGI